MSSQWEFFWTAKLYFFKREKRKIPQERWRPSWISLKIKTLLRNKFWLPDTDKPWLEWNPHLNEDYADEPSHLRGKLRMESINPQHRQNGCVSQLLLLAYRSKLSIKALIDDIPSSRSKSRRERRWVYTKINLGYGFGDNSVKEHGERATRWQGNHWILSLLLDTLAGAANSLPPTPFTAQCRG